MAISALSNAQIPEGQVVFGHEVPPEIFETIKLDNPNFEPNNCLSIDELHFYRKKYLDSVWKKMEQDLAELNHLGNANAGAAATSSGKPKSQLTLGQRVADKVATFGGSWTFIILFFLFIVVWIFSNIWFFASDPFDPYPFILLNLLLSCLAAIQAPIIMMSQNRKDSKDRARAMKDLQIDLKAEMGIKQLNTKMDALLKFQKSGWAARQEQQVEEENAANTEIKNRPN